MTKNIYNDRDYFDKRFGNIDSNIGDMIGRLENMEKRVSALEGFKIQVLVGVSIATAIISFLSNEIKKRLGWA